MTSTRTVLRTGQVAASIRPNQSGTTGNGKLGKELVQAAWTGNELAVKALLTQGADVFYQDSDGFRAIDRARDNGHRTIVTLLLEAEKAKK
ncbi:hypothetical protein AWR27_01910 [Spirosoma montaniterrae]|uniref:Uncharacterized protein n=1 Tax=Spirosoma montaniterrae TaxID=1178516 RepID=A0A1P9WS68_9BACT|nr:hypothetical protein AWR27_01910 [Spirosoma montaniterrae]